MTILLTEFRQETNSLSPLTSDLEFWTRNGWILSPSEASEFLTSQECAVAGMKEVLDSTGQRVGFGPAFYSQSGGPTEHSVLETYMSRLHDVLSSTPDLEAVFFSFHGALQTTEVDDAEAEVLRRVRDIVGPDVILAASTDSHGFITLDMVDLLNVVTGYHTYPHTDFVETGRRAARLALRYLENPGSISRAWVPVPMVVSASGYDTLQGPYRHLIDTGQKLIADEHIIDFSVYQMQPWLDVSEPTSAVVVYADTPYIASNYAAKLATNLYRHRNDFEPVLQDVVTVLRDIASGRKLDRPVVLVDSADSPNAGACGDSVFVVAKALEASIPLDRSLSVLSVVAAPSAVSEFIGAGVGSVLELELGQDTDRDRGSVFAAFHVLSLHTGSFHNSGPGSSGNESHLGRTAVVRAEQGNVTVDIVVCEQLVSPGDPALYRSVGCEPGDYDVVVVKANTSFKAAYEPIMNRSVMIDSPGSAPADIKTAPFHKHPRNIYPWVDTDYQPDPVTR